MPEEITTDDKLARLERSFTATGDAFSRRTAAREAAELPVNLEEIAGLKTSGLIVKLVEFAETLPPQELEELAVLLAPAAKVAQEISRDARSDEEAEATQLLATLDVSLDRGEARARMATGSVAASPTITITTTVTVTASHPTIGCN